MQQRTIVRSHLNLQAHCIRPIWFNGKTVPNIVKEDSNVMPTRSTPKRTTRPANIFVTHGMSANNAFEHALSRQCARAYFAQAHTSSRSLALPRCQHSWFVALKSCGLPCSERWGSAAVASCDANGFCRSTQ